MIRPLGDRVLIKPAQNPDQTESGLWLSEHRKPDTQGTVVAIGECLKWPDLRLGDDVVFSWASGQDLVINDERYIVMREADVLAVFAEDECQMS